MDAHGFVSDISLPRMLHALTVRSPVAGGRLISIERPELPEGCTLVEARDVPGENALLDSGLPILAGGTLSYVGEPVALLLGPDLNALEKFAGECKIVAEEGVPVFSTGEAAALAETEPGVIAASREVRLGEPEEAFAAAASVVKSDYKTGIQEHWYSEPCGAIAWLELPEPDDETEEPGEAETPEEPVDDDRKGRKLAVHTATQWPLHVRHSVARVLGLTATAVRVRPATVGRHMDGKLWYPSLVSCHAALGAWITGKPVRLILSRKEDFMFSPKRFAAGVTVSSAFDEKGELVGTEIRATLNAGAYGVGAAEALDQLCLGSLGLYASKNVSFKGTALRTNIPPQGAFAGFGLAQGFFAMERHVSLVAEERGQDPAEWRSANLHKPGTLPPGLPVEEAIPGGRLIDTALDMSDYRRKWSSYELLRRKRKELASQDDPHQGARAEKNETLRGIGVALAYQGNGLLHHTLGGGNYGVELTLEKDGSLEIKTGTVDVHRNAIWTNIAAEILGVDPGNVRINRGADSSAKFEPPESGPATMSHKATSLTRLVEQACLAIRGQRFRDPLPISVSKTGGPVEHPEWNRLLALPGGEALDCAGFLRPGSAAVAVEVEIDPVEHVPRVRGVWMAVDGGRIFHEGRARGSLRISAAQALGWAYREHADYVSGRIPEETFYDFDIPGLPEIPPVKITFVKNLAGESGEPGEPKGIGDLPFNCVPAAYLQAVSQAADWHFSSVPLKAQDVWYAGMTKRAEGAAPARGAAQ